MSDGAPAGGGARTALLTGVPRSGTTLVCHLLNQLPDVVALHEPIPLSGLRGRGTRRTLRRDVLADRLDAFLAEARASLLREGTAVSKQREGRVPDNPIGAPGALASGASWRTRLRRASRRLRGQAPLRRGQVTRGLLRVAKPLSPDFLLCAKHPSLYTALLEELVPRHPVFAVVRNPLAVLASWNSVEFGVSRGRARAAERLDAQLARRLAGIPETHARQLALLDWFFRRLRDQLPRGNVLRYEEIVASRGAALRRVAGRELPACADLESLNHNKLYDAALMRSLGERLLDREGAWWSFYSPASVEQLLEAAQ